MDILMESVTMSVGGVVMLCVTCTGLGACIAHWVDERWGRCER